MRNIREALQELIQEKGLQAALELVADAAESLGSDLIDSGKVDEAAVMSGEAAKIRGLKVAELAPLGVNIPLSNGGFCLIDAADYPVVARWTWYVANTGYASRGLSRNAKQAKEFMHRMLTNCPKGLVIDHANNNRLDNRRCNLRVTTQSQNMRNIRLTSRNTSGFKGVSAPGKDRKKWEAHISINGKKKSLGRYNTAEEAARAYDAKAREVAGEYASVNFP